MLPGLFQWVALGERTELPKSGRQDGCDELIAWPGVRIASWPSNGQVLMIE